jgi:hypothetical protein
VVGVDEVEEWLARLPVRLEYLGEFHTRDQVDLDFSAESLAGLEEYVLDWFEALDDVHEDEESEWVFEGVAGYLGEVMLRLAGGGWRAPAVQQVPLIEADEALDLAALSPADLILTAIRSRVGDEFRRAYADWDRFVRAYGESHPSWAPTKRLTPGVDPFQPPQTDVEHLSLWLAQREQGFAHWAAEYGAAIVWDFSARSLDDLSSLLLRITPTPSALDDPANRDFVEGAAWYTGETWRRVKGGRWIYRHGDPNVNMFNGYPFVKQPGEDALAAVPHHALVAVVKRRDPHHLYRHYEGFAE